VHNLVEMVGGDARADLAGGGVEHFARQAAHFAHGLLLLLVEDGDLVPDRGDALVVGDAVGGIFGELDVGGHFAARGEGVHGAQRAGVREGGEGVEVAGFWARSTIIQERRGRLLWVLWIFLCSFQFFLKQSWEQK
jgi:hypothetical protein